MSTVQADSNRDENCDTNSVVLLRISTLTHGAVAGSVVPCSSWQAFPAPHPRCYCYSILSSPLTDSPLNLTHSLLHRQGIVGEGSAGPGVGLLSAVTSAVVVHKVSSEEGIYGMYVPRSCSYHLGSLSF
jgi:hypothetical protein